MRSHDPVSAPAGPSAVGAARAQAGLDESYARLTRLAYLVLTPSLGRNRRVLTAHALVQRSLSRRRRDGMPAVPPPRAGREGSEAVEALESDYAEVRADVLRQALDAERPLLRFALPKRSQLPRLLPRVWGLRMSPEPGGADELALDQRLSRLSATARAAFVLRALEGLSDAQARRALGDAGVDAPVTALAEADGVSGTSHTGAPLLLSPEFDPCRLRARPTDLARRRQHGRAALAAAAALVVCGALLGLPGGGLGTDGAAAPAYARNPSAEAALDPAKVVRAAPAAWRTASRTDFSVWPARGPLVKDAALLGRALAVWARPGPAVQVSTTPGTPSGPPMGPPQLLYAGTLDRARVVLFYDGLRVVRYAEAQDGGDGAALDFARVDHADGASADALVVDRSDDNVRYLTAPWVTGTSVRDLLDPHGRARPLHRDGDGVTGPVDSPALAGTCTSWDTLQVRDRAGDGTGGAAGGSATRLLTDLGELTPARLTSGAPSDPTDVTGASDRASWARTACLLPAMRGHGVRTVNSWQYAQQDLPDRDGAASWVCTRGDTWEGGDSRVLAQFQAPLPAGSGGRTPNPGAVAATAVGSPACGDDATPQVLAGVLWKSTTGRWYLLGGGSDQVASVTARGGVTGSASGHLLAVPAKQGARADLAGKLADGRPVRALG